GLPLPEHEERRRSELRYLACRFAGVGRAVTDLAVLSDGRLASGGEDGTVRVWDPHKGEPLALRGHGGPVFALAALPDGRLASGGEGGAVRVWGPHKGEPLALQGPEGPVFALAVLPDGRLVSSGAVLPDGRLDSSGADGTMRVWDPGKGESSSLMRGHL